MTLKLSKRVRESIATGPTRATLKTRAYQAYGHRARFRLKPS
jgi:hypothetical protein